MATFLDWAIKYAEKGIDVFPLQAKNKIPMRDFSWNVLATQDAEKLREWWRSWPNSNVGLATGKRSGIVILDVDAGHGGEETLEILTGLHGALPETPEVKTGGGGRHIFFQHPGFEIRNSAGKLGMGLDIRGDGGYVVAAPSIHPNGNRYIIDDEKPKIPNYAPMPKWMVEALLKETQVQHQQPEPGSPAGAVNKIVSGQRNTALTSLAGTMRKRGMTGEALLAALTEENKNRCVPPLEDDEIAAIVKSVMEYDIPQATPRVKRVEAEWLLCAAAYQSPEVAAQEAGYISPYQFTDRKLGQFWNAVFVEHLDKVQSATEAGVIKELIALGDRVNIWDMANYAAQMTRHEYLDILSFRIADLSREIQEEDTTGAQKVVNEMASMMPGSGRDPVSGADAVLDFKMILDNMGGRSIMTGIPMIDRALGGLERQTFTILAARPSMGKSTLAWQIAQTVARNGGKALFFSLEMARMQLIAKSVCGELGIAWKDVRTILSSTEPERQQERDNLRARLIAKADEIGRRYGDALLIDDEPSNTEMIWQSVARIKPDFVIIDHLAKVQDIHPNEVQRLGIITGRLKQIAKKYNTHVLCLAQLNRAVETRDQKRPQLSDLRDSGNIEQDADNVIMIYRAEYYEDKTPTQFSETELWIRKFRDGARNECIKLDYDTIHQSFIDPRDRDRMTVAQPAQNLKR